MNPKELLPFFSLVYIYSTHEDVTYVTQDLFSNSSSLVFHCVKKSGLWVILEILFMVFDSNEYCFVLSFYECNCQFGHDVTSFCV